MRQPSPFVIAITLAVAVACSFAVSQESAIPKAQRTTSAGTSHSDADLAGIREHSEAFVTAFNRHDVKATLALNAAPSVHRFLLIALNLPTRLRRDPDST